MILVIVELLKLDTKNEFSLWLIAIPHGLGMPANVLTLPVIILITWFFLFGNKRERGRGEKGEGEKKRQRGGSREGRERGGGRGGERDTKPSGVSFLIESLPVSHM